MARENPRRMADDLRRLARFRRDHQTARPSAPDLTGRPDIDLLDAVQGYRQWARRVPDETTTAALLDDLETLAGFFADKFAGPLDFASLWRLTAPPALPIRLDKGLALRRLRTASAWRRITGEIEGARLEAESQAHFARVDAAYAELLGRIAAALVHRLSGELDQVLADYQSYKRAAAVLDFDDLLHLAARLVRDRPEVRQALSERFQYMLVDEFQDTDPIQCEIVFRLAAAGDGAWADLTPRPGALFLVGDPKQAIYRFRGASVETYELAKAIIGREKPDNILHITANFRSRSGILAHVNGTFAAPLSAEGQPGYVDLVGTRPEDIGCVSAVRLPVSIAPGAFREEAQDAEAEAVAAACASLVGAALLSARTRASRAVAPSDLALLAPTGTDLWRYERALERVGLPFASQAGKGLWRRQEAQDLLALARTLADPRDTLAFGALLRGPLVGLMDETILDAAEDLRAAGSLLRIDAPLDQVNDPSLRRVLSILQPLRRSVARTTPVQILSEAVERLGMRAILALRDPRQAAAAQANVDAILAKAARYGVRGLRRFVQDLTSDWRDGKAAVEGRIEADGAAIDIVTMHSAKGLEWPVVIPINGMVQTRPPEPYVRRPEDDSLHWRIGGVEPPALAKALEAEAQGDARERARIWYVACTRAKDLLILPELQGASARSWVRILDLRVGDLPILDLRAVDRPQVTASAPVRNLQDRVAFETEAERVVAASLPVTWIHPSAHDADLRSEESAIEDEFDGMPAPAPIAGGRVRGLVLHKLMEEVIGGALVADRQGLARRAAELVPQVEVLAREQAFVLDSAELAETVMATLALPDVAAVLPRLVAEVEVFGRLGEGTDAFRVSGRADALVVGRSGEAEAVIDWKSDAAPGTAQIAAYVAQLRTYLSAMGVQRGMLVFMTLGWVVWVKAEDLGSC